MSLDHEQMQAALASHALGGLDPAEAEALRAHLEGCESCRAELASLREAAGALAWAAPAVPLDPARSAELRARLLARAAAEGRGADPARVQDRAAVSPAARVIPLAPRARSASLPWLAAAAALLLAIGVGLWGGRTRAAYHALGRRYLAAREDNRRLRGEVARRDSALDALGGAGVRVIELASTHQQAPSGRMFWDPSSARWTFFAHHLPALRQGRDYQLWLITPAGPVSAGTFRPGAGGRAVVRATYALAPDALRAVAVTEEPAGGLPQPSGTPLILGSMSE